MLYEKLTLYPIFSHFVAYFFKFIFYWSIVELQRCVNYCCTAKWLSYTHIYILSHILFHYGLSQDIEYSSLCYTVGPCCLSILYIPVFICQSQTPNPTLSYPLPTWQPLVCFLHLWVCFFFVIFPSLLYFFRFHI